MNNDDSSKAHDLWQNPWDEAVSLEDLQNKINDLQKDDAEKSNAQNLSSNDGFESKYNEINDKYIRLYAEFENYKRRTWEERFKLINMWAIWILKIIITFFDDFKRASEQCPKEIWDSDFWKWIKLIESNLIKEFEKKWLVKLDILGKPFDPNKMESLMQDPNSPKWTVSKVLEDWYEYSWDIARVAKVIVGSWS